jgi:hypothetical protein
MLLGLLQVIESEMAHVPARVRGAQLFHMLACSPEGVKLVSPKMLVDVIMYLLRSPIVQLQEVRCT